MSVRPRGTLILAGLLGLAAACSDTSTNSQPVPSISLDFEGSSLGDWALAGQDTLLFRLRPDTNAGTRFWFSFRVLDARGKALTFRLPDALVSASHGAWSVKRPVASGDGGGTWTRIEDVSMTEADGFVFRHTPSSADEWIALALPYNVSRWTDLVSSVSGSQWVRSVRSIGQSLEGNDLPMLEITDGSAPAAEKSAVWVVARQHPGEPEGSYMMEGFLEWILGNDAPAAELRRQAEIYVVGFLNPDGVLAGNQRVNLAGVDINRHWNGADPLLVPTIEAVQREILSYSEQGGQVRILVDFHAAPGGRQNFFYYNEEATSSAPVHAEIVRVIEAAVRRNPDFVPLEGSTARPVPTGERARNWAFDRLQTHGLTVEASSNDVFYGPFEGQWVTEPRLKALGVTVGESVAEVLYGIGTPSALAHANGAAARAGATGISLR